MRKHDFGSTGERVSVIGQGTWGSERDPEQAIRALRHGLDLGMNHVDTAEKYADGAVEEVVGRAIAGRRDDVYLVGKVHPRNASRQGTIEACEASLRRLHTDHLDCYLLHWPGEHPLEETVEAFEELKRSGRIRDWGVSNFEARELEALVRRVGPGLCACNQVLYHLEAREAEADLLGLCTREQIALVAYSPLGGGRFPDPRSPGGRVLAEVAEVHDATPQQIALAFLTRHASVFAIPRALRLEHVEQNAAVTRIELGDEEVARLEEAFPIGVPQPA